MPAWPPGAAEGTRRVTLANFDPVKLATPFFILTVILEILLGRFGKAKVNYEVKDTAISLGMGLGSHESSVC